MKIKHPTWFTAAILALTACQPSEPESPVRGLERPVQPVIIRTPQATDPARRQAPEPQVQAPFQFTLTVDGREPSGVQRFTGVVDSIAAGQLVLKTPEETTVALAYTLGDDHALQIGPGRRLLIDVETGFVQGSVRRNLMVRSDDRLELVFLQDGGNEPVSRQVGPQLRIEQEVEQRTPVGEQGGIRDFSVPVRIALGERSRILAVGEEFVFDMPTGPVGVRVLKSSQQEAYGEDQERALARMEGPAFYLHVVLYR